MINFNINFPIKVIPLTNKTKLSCTVTKFINKYTYYSYNILHKKKYHKKTLFFILLRSISLPPLSIHSIHFVKVKP